MKTRRITKIRAGEDLFTSTGVSRIKVTKEGRVECLEIPITSTGISELIDAFRRDAPKPPVKNVKVTPDSELGRQMRISRNEWVKMPDLADPEYIKAKEKHDSDLGLAIVLKGLAVEIEDENGNLVTDDREKIRILKERGLTGEQFSQLVDDITNLTKWTEEEEARFFV